MVVSCHMGLLLPSFPAIFLKTTQSFWYRQCVPFENILYMKKVLFFIAMGFSAYATAQRLLTPCGIPTSVRAVQRVFLALVALLLHWVPILVS